MLPILVFVKCTLNLHEYAKLNWNKGLTFVKPTRSTQPVTPLTRFGPTWYILHIQIPWLGIQSHTKERYRKKLKTNSTIRPTTPSTLPPTHEKVWHCEPDCKILARPKIITALIYWSGHPRQTFLVRLWQRFQYSQIQTIKPCPYNELSN